MGGEWAREEASVSLTEGPLLLSQGWKEDPELARQTGEALPGAGGGGGGVGAVVTACAKARGCEIWGSLIALFARAGWGGRAGGVFSGPLTPCPLPPPTALCSPPAPLCGAEMNAAYNLDVQELQELERKLEEELAHQEAAQWQRALAGRQQWAEDGPGLLTEPEDADSEGQVSAVLRRALGRSQELLERQQQR